MIKLFITDLDDTLYSWIGFFIPAFYAMAEKVAEILDIPLDKLLEEYKLVHKNKGSVEFPHATLLLPSVQKILGDLSKEEQRRRLDPAFHRFNSKRKHLLRLYPGVEEALRYMQQQRIAIVGYTESAEENGFYRLKKLGIEQYFKKIYVSDSTYKRSDYTEKSPKTQIVHGIKPNPELLKQICQDEECLFTEAIYMGDSLTKDIMMAKEAGIISVWVDIPEQNPDLYKQLIQISHWSETDFTREKENREKWERCAYSPDYTITDLGQLEQIIKQINYPCLSDIGTNKR